MDLDAVAIKELQQRRGITHKSSSIASEGIAASVKLLSDIPMGKAWEEIPDTLVFLQPLIV